MLHDDLVFYQISKMDLYHRLFWDSLGNSIRFEKNHVLNCFFSVTTSTGRKIKNSFSKSPSNFGVTNKFCGNRLSTPGEGPQPPNPRIRSNVFQKSFFVKRLKIGHFSGLKLHFFGYDLRRSKNQKFL